jgi:beta-carotene hydroxylase
MSKSSAPSLDELCRDLLQVPRRRVVLSLVSPFALAAGYFGFAFAGWWPAAMGCMIALSFVTYGSVSHDLVHRSLGLGRRVNDWLLTAIELLLLRSGRAYRLVHLNHHTRYPHLDSDPEGSAAGGTFWAALRSGPLFFFRLWWWAVRRFPSHRPRLLAEAAAVVALVAGSVVSAWVGWSAVFLVYALLAYFGTWVVPLATSYIPHTPSGDNPLSQTRRFRGRAVRLLALDHLYHLEHHLYPAIPHHHWPELARRLDPYLDALNVPAVRLTH